MDTKTLPVWTAMPALIAAVREGRNVVLIAPPGSGKTTQAPQALLEEGLCKGAIVVVQPRRIACTTVAMRVAEERGIPIGDEVGYLVRYDGQVTSKTRLLFVTDGVLLRLMERDPELSWASIIIFDEFHERRASGDLALGLLKQAQTRRRGLQIIAMSATMQSERVANYLNAVTLEAEGRAYPVEVQYDDQVSDEEMAVEAVPRWVAKLHHSSDPGDILVFLPGKGEIQRTARLLEPLQKQGVAVLQLHGDLSQDEQHGVFLPLNVRKVILATNVAETSVTVPGVRFVIDSGLERRAEYDAGLRISHLNLVRVSQASADQRTGRAGREAPGLCIRLWKKSSHRALIQTTAVEMQSADIAGVVMTLKSLGVHRPSAFSFLDAPDTKRLEAAEEFLKHIGALNNEGDLTPIGWRMLRLPLPPRYGRMVVEGEMNGCLNEMATIASLMTGRALFVQNQAGKQAARQMHARHNSSDFFTLLELHHASQARDQDLDQWCKENGVRVDALVEANRLRRKVIDIATERKSFFNRRPAHMDVVRRCILTGLVDMVAMRKQGRTYQLANGMLCMKDDASTATGDLVVAASVRVRRNAADSNGIIGFLTQIEPTTLQRAIEHLTYVVRIPIAFHQADGTLTVREDTRYQELVISSAEKRVEGPAIEIIFTEQRERATRFGWQRVEIVPGISHRSHVTWKGAQIEVVTDQTGPHWASVEEEPRVVIKPRERIVDVERPKQSLTAPLPGDLAQRIAKLSPAVSKLLGR